MGLTRPVQRTQSNAYPPAGNYAQPQVRIGVPASFTSPPPVGQNSQWPPPPNAPPPTDPWGRASVPPASSPTSAYNPTQFGPMPGGRHQVAPPVPPRIPDHQSQYGQQVAYSPVPQHPPQLPARPLSIPPVHPPPINAVPAGYQAEVQQNQQAWPQQPAYSVQPPSQAFNPKTSGNTYDQYGQDGRQSVPPSRFSTHSVHLPPPPPPKTYGDSFPPAGPPRPPSAASYQQLPLGNEPTPQGVASSAFTVEEGTPTVGRPNEQYMSYPLQGQQVPAISHHQSNSSVSFLQPGTVLPPQQQFQHQQAVMPQPHGTTEHHGQPQPQQQQDAGYVFSQPGVESGRPSPQQVFARPLQQTSSPKDFGGQQVAPGGAFQQPSAGPEPFTSQPQSVSPYAPHQASMYGTPPSTIKHNLPGHSSHPGYQPTDSAYGSSQPQIEEPSQILPNQSLNQHQEGYPVPPANTNNTQSASENQSDPTAPVSPLHRMSMSFDQSQGSRQSLSGIPSRSESQMSRKSAIAQSDHAAAASQPIKRYPANAVPSAFTFSSFGGPGDWEHYGDGPDEIDDTAMYGVKQDENVKTLPPVGVELPAEVPSSMNLASKPMVLPPVEEAELAATEAGPSPEPDVVLASPPHLEQPVLIAAAAQSSVVVDNGGSASAQSTVTRSAVPTQSANEPSLASTASVPTGDGQMHPVQRLDSKKERTAPPSISRTVQNNTLLAIQAEIDQHREVAAQAEAALIETQQQAEEYRLLAEREAEAARVTRNDLLTARTQLEQVNRALAASQEELEVSSNRVQALEASFTEVERNLTLTRDQFDAERTVLQKMTSELHAALADAQTTHDSEKQHLQSRVTEVEASLIVATAATAATVTEHENSKKQIQELSVRVDELMKQADERSQEIDQLKRQAEKKTDELAMINKMLDEERSNPPDLLPGLDPWFKGSLERFMAVLKIEATASTVQEKMNAFIEFVNDESRLRGVNMPFTTTGEPIGFQQQRSPPRQGAAQSPPKIERKAQLPPINPPSETAIDEDAIEYSPGGRPIMRPLISIAQSGDRPRSQSPSKSRSTSGATAGAAGAAPPLPPKDSYRPYREGSLSSTNDHSVPQPGLKLDTQKPAYQPSVYQLSGPASQTPTAERVQTPVSNRNAVSAPIVPTLSMKPENELFTNPFTGTSTSKPAAPVLVNDTIIPLPLKPKTPGRVNPEAQSSRSPHRLAPLQHLATLLPPLKMPLPTVVPRIATLQRGLETFSSDYSFVTDLLKGWEKRASTIRAQLESERRLRQETKEQRNNERFESDEIGYGDIKELEDQQKGEELKLQAQEEREDYESYAKEVFDAAFRQLQQQIGRLMDLYANAEDAMKDSVAGGRALDIREGEDIVEIGDAMDMLLKIHAAIEERHGEVNRCVAERDRRFKRTQISPLYRRGQIADMKRMEKGFEANERRAEVKAAVEKIERSKRLWKAMDAQASRGVGENQDFVEELLKAVDAVSKDESALGDAEKARERDALLHQARDALATLAGSSRRLMQLFETAEMDLNECEYNVSVSSARLDGRDQQYFVQLQGEKSAEDSKLKEESVKRLKGIDDDLTEALGLVEKVLGIKRNSTAAGAQDEDEEEKQRRLKSALEEAKRRNGEAA